MCDEREMLTGAPIERLHSTHTALHYSPAEAQIAVVVPDDVEARFLSTPLCCLQPTQHGASGSPVNSVKCAARDRSGQCLEEKAPLDTVEPIVRRSVVLTGGEPVVVTRRDELHLQEQSTQARWDYFVTCALPGGSHILVVFSKAAPPTTHGIEEAPSKVESGAAVIRVRPQSQTHPSIRRASSRLRDMAPSAGAVDRRPLLKVPLFSQVLSIAAPRSSYLPLMGLAGVVVDHFHSDEGASMRNTVVPPASTSEGVKSERSAADIASAPQLAVASHEGGGSSVSTPPSRCFARVVLSDTVSHSLWCAEVDARSMKVKVVSRSSFDEYRADSPPSVPTTQPRAVVGTGEAGHTDGTFAVAAFHSPAAICWKHTALVENGAHRPRLCCSVLFVSDTGNRCIRLVDFATQMVRTLAGGSMALPGSCQRLGGVNLHKKEKRPDLPYRDGSAATAATVEKAAALVYCSQGLVFAEEQSGTLRLVTNTDDTERSTTPPEASLHSTIQERQHVAESSAGARSGELSLSSLPAVSVDSNLAHAATLASSNPFELSLPRPKHRIVEGHKIGKYLPTPAERLVVAHEGERSHVNTAECRESNASSASSVAVATPSRRWVWTVAGKATCGPRRTLPVCTTVMTSLLAGTAIAPAAEAMGTQYVDGAPAEDAVFASPSSLSFLPSGELLVADTQNSALRIVRHNCATTYVSILDYEAGGTPSRSVPRGLVGVSHVTVLVMVPPAVDATEHPTMDGAPVAAEEMEAERYGEARAVLVVASAATGTVSIIFPTTGDDNTADGAPARSGEVATARELRDWIAFSQVFDGGASRLLTVEEYLVSTKKILPLPVVRGQAVVDSNAVINVGSAFDHAYQIDVHDGAAPARTTAAPEGTSPGSVTRERAPDTPPRLKGDASSEMPHRSQTASEGFRVHSAVRRTQSVARASQPILGAVDPPRRARSAALRRPRQQVLSARHRSEASRTEPQGPSATTNLLPDWGRAVVNQAHMRVAEWPFVGAAAGATAPQLSPMVKTLPPEESSTRGPARPAKSSCSMRATSKGNQPEPTTRCAVETSASHGPPRNMSPSPVSLSLQHALLREHGWKPPSEFSFRHAVARQVPFRCLLRTTSPSGRGCAARTTEKSLPDPLDNTALMNPSPTKKTSTSPGGEHQPDAVLEHPTVSLSVLHPPTCGIENGAEERAMATRRASAARIRKVLAYSNAHGGAALCDSPANRRSTEPLVTSGPTPKVAQSAARKCENTKHARVVRRLPSDDVARRSRGHSSPVGGVAATVERKRDSDPAGNQPPAATDPLFSLYVQRAVRQSNSAVEACCSISRCATRGESGRSVHSRDEAGVHVTLPAPVARTASGAASWRTLEKGGRAPRHDGDRKSPSPGPAKLVALRCSRAMSLISFWAVLMEVGVVAVQPPPAADRAPPMAMDWRNLVEVMHTMSVRRHGYHVQAMMPFSFFAGAVRFFVNAAEALTLPAVGRSVSEALASVETAARQSLGDERSIESITAMALRRAAAFHERMVTERAATWSDAGAQPHNRLRELVGLLVVNETAFRELFGAYSLEITATVARSSADGGSSAQITRTRDGSAQIFYLDDHLRCLHQLNSSLVSVAFDHLEEAAPQPLRVHGWPKCSSRTAPAATRSTASALLPAQPAPASATLKQKFLSFQRFQSLCFALGIFPSLVDRTFLLRAFMDALCVPLIQAPPWDGSTSPDGTALANPETPLARRAAAPVDAQPSVSALTESGASFSLPSYTTAAAWLAYASVDMLEAAACPDPMHRTSPLPPGTRPASSDGAGGTSAAASPASAKPSHALSFLQFVEAFVRLALTAFTLPSDANRGGQPSAARKTVALMKWVNRDLHQGGPKQRTRHHADCGSVSFPESFKGFQIASRHLE